MRGSVVAETFFLPRVRFVVVAVALPEARSIVRGELEATNPLRALPEIALRHHQAERVAVVRRERRAIGDVGQEYVVIVEHRERKVRGVALLGVNDYELGRRPQLRALEDH